MENKFNFDSSVCTSIEQSKKLVALGLKKETADMSYNYQRTSGDYELSVNAYADILSLKDRMNNRKVLGMGWDELWGNDLPAWSLHRLIEMIQEVCLRVFIIFHRVYIKSNVKSIAYSFDVCDNLYDNIIDCIEWLIKEEYLEKEYLE